MSLGADRAYTDIARCSVLHQSATHWKIALILNEDAAMFAHHFEIFPVVPGVMQLKWVFEFGVQLMAQHPYFGAGVADLGYRIKNLKFRAPMQPQHSYVLELHHTQTGFRFNISSPHKVVSTGQVEYER